VEGSLIFLLALGEHTPWLACIWVWMHAQKVKAHNHFSHEKSFVLVEITFFRLNFCENSLEKNMDA
jgi:hypothetical protein